MGKKPELVMAFGSFDIIHPGHILYFKKAKSLGRRLLVIVARDESIRALKKRPPAMPERGRLQIVSSIRFVDRAVLGNKLSKERDKYWIFKRYRPDVIALGYDQKANIPEMRSRLIEMGIRARIIRIKNRASVTVFKSSIIKDKV